MILFFYLSGVFAFCNARHLLLQSHLNPESVDIEEGEFMNDKFQPREFVGLPPELRDNKRAILPTVGFAEASPDILLERLVDEIDDYCCNEDVAEQGIVHSPIIADRKEEIESDLDEP